mgnify:CR=1 FL=1
MLIVIILAMVVGLLLFLRMRVPDPTPQDWQEVHSGRFPDGSWILIQAAARRPRKTTREYG